MKALVVPSIRQDSLFNFIDRWYFDPNIEIYVVEDNPEKTFSLDEGVHHYSWKEIDETLGDDAWIISRRDSAIRSFGFLMAYNDGAEQIFTLDDDCSPKTLTFENDRDFVHGHMDALYNCSKWTESVFGKRTRGIPYKNKGKFEDVWINMGLWLKNPDLDAVQTLAGEEAALWGDEAWKNQPSRIIPHGLYFPMCGMNLAFKREATPLMYFPLMGEGVPYRRFDDIWCGIIAKKVCDHLNKSIACGQPYIIHERASDPFVNLVKEAPGIKQNETFWEIIDAIPLKEKTPAGCMVEIGKSLRLSQDDYLSKLGRAIMIWAGLFR